MIEIGLGNVRDYLVQHQLLDPRSEPEISEMAWGISNVVLRVDLPAGGFVLKQSLPKLRVADDWQFDRRRTLIERDCMVLLSQLLPVGSVPTALFCDEENFVLVMSQAPAGGVLWKQALMEGDIDVGATERAGELLASIHNLTAQDARTETLFSNQTTFIQGRVDPYHWTVAKAHPDLAPAIHRETDRMLATRLSLVHGDFSPKNIFVYPERLLLLDFEVAHLGDPAFDSAFCLTHFILKAFRFPDRASQYLDAAQVFWASYLSAVQPSLSADIGANTVRELACLLLARIDGKSKIEYITEEPVKDEVRTLGRTILLVGGESLSDVLDAASRQLTVSGRA
jgi:5-methylthioribose kinase